MRTLFLLVILTVLNPCPVRSWAQKDTGQFVLVIHGGAGTINRERLTPAQEADYIGSLEKALAAGYSILSAGGTALDAVEQSVRVLEDDSLFNAGKGAVFTHEGRNELDASIMDGSNLRAGAVAGGHRHP